MRDQQARRQPDTSGVDDRGDPDISCEALWALIEPRPLMREALTCMMAGSRTQPMIGAASAEDLVNRVMNADQRVTLVIFHVSGRALDGEQLRHEYSLLRSRFGAVPMVILNDRVDLGEVSCAFRAGARGYISTSSSCAAAMWALKHVEAGNVYVPEEVLSDFLHTAQDDRQDIMRQAGAGNRTFTPRQLQVLTLLREGKPNKIIAYELEMQESTVKVHVREIMKKLKVTNRTEAAFRAGQLLAKLDDQSKPSQQSAGSTGSVR